MKFSYTFVVLLIIQLALKYVKADLGSKDMACENGSVVQYGHSYECKCDEGYTHKDANACVKSDTLVNTCDAGTVGQLCGAFAKCAENTTSPGTYVCQCNANYVASSPKPTHCVPSPCNNVKCVQGVCAVDNNKAVCSCFVNHKHKDEQDKTTECVEGGEHTCDLPCVDNAHCQLHKDGYYFCECINKKPMVNGACSNAITSFLSPFNVLFIIGVYIIYLKSA